MGSEVDSFTGVEPIYKPSPSLHFPPIYYIVECREKIYETGGNVCRVRDPSTQVGACIVSQDNKILSMGYNGFPKGCSDDEFPWEKEHEADDPYHAKYFYSTHSELNAILNYRGGSLEGSKLYVTLFPCNECAKAIIQAGITTIVYGEDKYADTPAVRASKRMLNAAGVRYYQYQPTGRKIEIEV